MRKILSYIGDGAPTSRPIRTIRRHKSESFDYTLTNNPDELKAEWIRDFPEDRAGIEKIFAIGKVMGSRMVSYGDLMRTAAVRSWWEKILYGLRMLYWSYPFWRYVRWSAEYGLNKYLTNEKLKSIYCTEEEFMAVLVPIGWAYYGDYQMPPLGGTQSFAHWLLEQIEGFGSRLISRVGVERVLIEDGTAVGVRLDNGLEMRAKFVIAACDVEALYERMLPPDAVSDELKKRLRNAELYDSCVTLSLGLDCDARDLGFSEEMVFLTHDGLTRKEHNEGDPHKAGLSLIAASVRDASLAPPGKGTHTLSCRRL